MSEATSALAGARFEGIARIEEAGLQGMLTLRGDLASPALREAVRAASGVEVPGLREFAIAGPRAAAWMSPDEVLLLMPYGEAPEAADELRKRLAGEFALVAEVSDARARFRITGPQARDVLAKLCPVDLAPAAFGPGQIRRTRAAQVPMALWLEGSGGEESFSLICFRSVAQYVFDLLCEAARPGGEVGFHTAATGRGEA